MSRPTTVATGRSAALARLLAVALACAPPAAATAAAAPPDEAAEEEIALGLANLLRAARAVIAAHQDEINDPAPGDKGLTAEVVVAETLDNYRRATGGDPLAVDPESRQGRLLGAQLAAIGEVMDENQAAINRPGVGFKGFVPAVFGRLVAERLAVKAGNEARMKVTAPAELVRNRRARPDAWEAAAIEDALRSPDWPEGRAFEGEAEIGGRSAYRLLVPEYYSAGCLACHGEPKGEIDVTGYPKEGGALGDLGGVISVTLFR